MPSTIRWFTAARSVHANRPPRARRMLENLESRLLLSASPAQIASALDLPAGTAVSYSGNAQAVQVRSRDATAALLGFPTGRDEDFLILSTGTASQADTLGNTSGSQGTDLGAAGVAGDAATINFTLKVPASTLTQKVKFEFIFLSEEYPEFVGSQFNDIFTASVNGVNVAKDQNGNAISVNNVLFDGALTTIGTFFDGRTALLTASYTIPAGVTSLPVNFSIADVGDGRYDSAVLLDSVRFETSQVVYLNFGGVNNLNFAGKTWNMPAFAATDLGYANNNNQQAVIDAIVAKVTSLYAGLDVSFTTTKPASGDFSTLNIGGDDSALNTTPNSILFGQGDTVDIGNLNKKDNAVIFSQEFGPRYSPEAPDTIRDRISVTIAHELGHILGVRHLDNSYTDDVMKKNSPRDSTSTFHDELRNLPAVEAWPDAAAKQNDITYLKSVLGTPGDSSTLGASWNFLQQLLGGFITLDLGGLNVYDAQVGTYNAGTVTPDGELDADIAPQIIDVKKLSGIQTFFLPNFTNDDGFFLIGASKPGGPKDITTGGLDADGNPSFDAAAIDYLDNGKPKVGLQVKKKDAQGNLQTIGTLNLVANALPKNTGTFTDTDGDTYTVKLTGPGTVSFALDDADQDGRGPIGLIELAGTSATKSLLTVTVRKARNTGNGVVTIGQITGSALKSITASASDLTGTGITLAGQALGSLTLRDVLSGADISAGTGATTTSVTLRNVGDGTTMTFGGTVKTLKAVAIGDGSITAPAINTLTVSGAKNVPGNMLSDVTLTGPAGTTVLGTMSVAGTLNGATIQGGVGNLGTIKVGAASSANVFTGFAGPNLPSQLADFTADASIKSFTVSGIKGQAVSVVNTLVAARFITTFSVIDPDTINGQSGVAADTLNSASVSFLNAGKRTKTTLTKLDDPLESTTVQNVQILIL